MRAALAAAPESCDASDEALEAAAALIPAMIMGVAFSQHVFRGVDPRGFSSEHLARMVNTLLVGGVERLCAAEGASSDAQPAAAAGTTESHAAP
jgi:hypothetical protein